MVMCYIAYLSPLCWKSQKQLSQKLYEFHFLYFGHRLTSLGKMQKRHNIDERGCTFPSIRQKRLGQLERGAYCSANSSTFFIAYLQERELLLGIAAGKAWSRGVCSCCKYPDGCVCLIVFSSCVPGETQDIISTIYSFSSLYLCQ